MSGLSALLRSFSPGLRLMVAGAFFFSVMSLLVKLAGQRLPTLEIVLARAVVTVVLSLWALRAAGINPWGNNRKLLLVRGLFGFTGLSSFYYALVHLPLGDATVIQYTNPVFAAIFAVFLLHERLDWRDGVAVLASLAGVLLIARPALLFGGAEALPPLAVGIAMIGAITSGAAYVVVRRLGQTEHLLVIVFYFGLISAVLSAPLALPTALMPTPAEWLLLLGVGLTTHVAQLCITQGLSLERAGRATAAGYVQIVFAAVWGALFFAELPDWAMVAGAALIIGATLSLARRHSTG